MRPRHRLIVCAVFFVLLATSIAAAPCKGLAEAPFALPGSIAPEKLAEYEAEILKWLQRRAYATELRWCGDKGIRDTGPWINDVYYGTHKAARIYYSPAAMQWLIDGRKTPMPDGAMIIKEGIQAPAARWEGKTPAVNDWTIMIKDAKGAADGWWWAELWTGMTFDDHQWPYQYPNAGFGIYCTRCHASAEKESTFSALNNIEGFPGDFLTFRVDDSWRDDGSKTARHAPDPKPAPPAPPVAPNPAFLQTFRSIPPVAAADVVKLPNETWDHVPSTSGHPQMFMTSDQCQSCHSAAITPFGPAMWLTNKSGKGINVSPYTEWRWSPMGLAGRDPIFFAQLDSELSWIDTLPDAKTRESLKESVINTCFRCHGVMGRRQHEIDHPGQPFLLDYIQRTGSMPGAKYGALARDGISCTSCHHIRRDVIPPAWKKSPLEFFLTNTITGQFQTGPAEELFGPFKDDEIVTLPMDNALGVKPKHDDYIRSSRMCGSCHTIDLPVVDNPPAPINADTPHSIEQATYLEWLNSRYQNEFGTPGKFAQSCQDCHMPRDLKNELLDVDSGPINTRIAIVEDDSYPAAEHRAAVDDIRVRMREGTFSRHEFLGMNAFLLEMFNQFNDVLGVRKSDYMTGTSDNLQNTQANLFEQARKRTATVEVKPSISGRTLTADVTVTNLTGHRLPSGVGFRRAWIELLVLENRDSRERVVWSSGRTNSVGVIVDGEGRPLPTEFFEKNAYQEHHTLITSDDQVQIYEELSKDAEGNFTTSFIRRDEDVKDNRLLPIGWTKKGPDPSLNGRYLKATYPHGKAHDDPDYADGEGHDRVRYRIALPGGVDPAHVSVRATLYYQNIPPYYLNQRFTIGKGDATRRLYYIASNLNLEGTPMANWKIAITTAQQNAK